MYDIICLLSIAKLQNFLFAPRRTHHHIAVGGHCALLCQISSKSVKRLQRYGDLMLFTNAFTDAFCDLLTFDGGAENARLENVGLELSAPNCRGGKCRTGIIGNRKRMECHVWHNLFFVTVCTVIGISTWYTYEHRVIPAHLRHCQCRN